MTIGAPAVAFFRAPDGRRLAFRDWGGGAPAVLCLAGLTRSGRDFVPLAERLGERFDPPLRIVALDSRGRGLSEHAADPLAEYTIEREAADALALMDHLGIERAAIVGTSRGALLGMVLGAAARARVSCLVLNDVGPVIEPAGVEAILCWLGHPLPWSSFTEAAAGLEARMGAAFPDLDAGGWLALARTLFRDEGGRPVADYDLRLRAAVEAALAAGPVDLWPLFDALAGLPVMVIRGANSDILSAATLAEMQRRRPDLVAVTVPRQGHPPFLEEPPALPALESFLREHAR